jgi:hypothetical protein
LTDGETVACDDQGMPDFKLLIRKRRYRSANTTSEQILDGLPDSQPLAIKLYFYSLQLYWMVAFFNSGPVVWEAACADTEHKNEVICDASAKSNKRI